MTDLIDWATYLADYLCRDCGQPVIHLCVDPRTGRTRPVHADREWARDADHDARIGKMEDS